jgi:hypothetical protein
MANDGPSSTVSRVSVQGPNAFSVSLQDPSTGQLVTVNWQRMNQSANTGGGLAQPSIQPNQSPLVGTWQYNERTNAGHTITIRLSYSADGRFQVQRILNGQSLMSSYGGTYSYSPEAGYYETTTEKSPQFCYLQCEPNPVQLGTAGPMQIGFSNTNTLIYAGLSFQRAQAAPVGGMTQPGTFGGDTQNPGGFGTMQNPGGFNDTFPMMPAGTGSNGDFLNGVIWEQSAFNDPSGDGTFMLPNSPDPNTTYYAPNGNELNYNEGTSTWTEIDSYGFETEVDPSNP